MGLERIKGVAPLSEFTTVYENEEAGIEVYHDNEDTVTFNWHGRGLTLYYDFPHTKELAIALAFMKKGLEEQTLDKNQRWDADGVHIDYSIERDGKPFFDFFMGEIEILLTVEQLEMFAEGFAKLCIDLESKGLMKND